MIRWWLLLFCVLITPAAADSEPPDLPAIYGVSGVAASDILNVRQKPDSGSAQIGALDWDDDWVEVTALSRQGGWGRVNINGQSGWTSMRYLKPRKIAVDPLGLPTSLTCFGTEPFWSFQIKDQMLIVKRPEGQRDAPIEFSAPSAQNVNLAKTGFAFRWGNTKRLTRILPGTCSDGMSEALYGLHLTGPTLGYGCCSLDD